MKENVTELKEREKERHKKRMKEREREIEGREKIMNNGGKGELPFLQKKINSLLIGRS
jgi:hypothetical protein